MGIALAIGLAVTIAAVVLFKALAKRSALQGRTPLPMEDIYDSVKDQVSFEVFSEVWSVLGKAYSIDPELLRPTDTFVALGRMDSWTLGKGEDDVGKWLKERGIGAPPQPQTLIEFARWVQSSLATGAT
jgi:hypothetical protein